MSQYLQSANNFKGIFFASITAFFWGILAIALKVSLNYLDPFTIVWSRFFLAFSVLLIYFLVADRKQLYIFKRPPLLLIIGALGLGLNYLSFLKGINYIAPSSAQVLIQIAPILLGVVGFVFFKEKINFKQAIGFGIAGIGFYLFYQTQIQRFLGSPDVFYKGFLWIMTAALSWVIFAALQKKLVQKHPPQTLNMMLYCIPALFYMPMADFGAFQHLSLGTWALVIFLGINTLIAYGCLALALKYTQTYKVSIIITTNPIITIVIMTVLGYIQVSWIQPENLTFHAVTGAILFLGGAIIAIFFSRNNQNQLAAAKKKA